MLTNYINYAEKRYPVKTLGPGKRFVLWVQGCPFNCPNCIAPDWIPMKKANLIHLKELAAYIVALEDLDGITISGGEPMLQARRLAKMLKIVKEKRPNLNVIVFTGFQYKQLDFEEATEVLPYIDVLIDGTYVDKLNDGEGLRGSSNQNIHFLTEALTAHKTEILTGNRTLEFQIDEEEVMMIGIPEKDFSWYNKNK